MKNFVKYICLTVAVIVFSLAYMSRTLENLALKKVTLTAPVKGALDTAPDDILYKYIPYEAKTVSEVYETIVPLSALTPSGSDGTYVVYLALPLTGRGEAGQYIVSRAKVRLLADDGKSAAIDMVIRDGRQIIISGDEPVKHGEKVRAG